MAPSPLSGWLPDELEVLTHVRQVLDVGLLHLRHGSRARRVAEAERRQTLAAAGLDEAASRPGPSGGFTRGGALPWSWHRASSSLRCHRGMTMCATSPG